MVARFQGSSFRFSMGALAKADVVISVGYDPVEYGPDAWNVGKRARIIQIDDYPCDIDNYYQPEIELRGSIKDTLNELALHLQERPLTADAELQSIQAEFHTLQNPVAPPARKLVHPLNYVITDSRQRSCCRRTLSNLANVCIAGGDL